MQQHIKTTVPKMNLTTLCAWYSSGIFTSHTTAVHICTGLPQWGSAQTTLDLKNLIIKVTSISQTLKT